MSDENNTAPKTETQGIVERFMSQARKDKALQLHERKVAYMKECIHDAKPMIAHKNVAEKLHGDHQGLRIYKKSSGTELWIRTDGALIETTTDRRHIESDLRNPKTPEYVADKYGGMELVETLNNILDKFATNYTNDNQDSIRVLQVKAEREAKNQ